MSKKLKRTKTIEVLSKLGLSENEAALYSLMLRRPKSTVQEMAAQAPFSRTMLYHVLNQLTQRGLASATKEEWRTVYIAENPQRLYQLLNEKEEVFAEDSQEIRKIIPELKNKYRLAGQRPDVHIFEGLQEYKRALDDIIVSQPDLICAYTHPSNILKPGIEFRESSERKRIAKKIQKKLLLFKSEAAEKAIKKMDYNDHTQLRLITNKPESFTVDFQLYSGKILYTTYVDREPMAILIEDQLLYTMQKNLFDALWQQSESATLLSIN